MNSELTIKNMDHSPLPNSDHVEDGHTTGAPNMATPAAYVYIIFVAVYTMVMLMMLMGQWVFRHHTAIRLRGFWINFIAISAIHVYVAALFIVYPLNGSYKCNEEFWFMSIVFPLGLALCQASNTRLLVISTQQREVVKEARWMKQTVPFGFTPSKFFTWVKAQDFAVKTYMGIAVGLIVQVSPCELKSVTVLTN